MKKFSISVITPNEFSGKAVNDKFQALKTTDKKPTGVYKDLSNGEILITCESEPSFESLVGILISENH
ncbi:hypothetical protein [Desertivirga brevis]|uniref:hypothetical protein n=1 Tax=Desertivirga brevis TaxID=2810310 RepID=UPI001A96758A|nr:hypothetical protein [Pedobacter sp. SYSU D00873]